MTVISYTCKTIKTMTQEQAAKYKDHDEYVLECLNLAKAGLLKTYRVNDEFWRMMDKRRKEKQLRQKQFNEHENN